MNSNPHTELVNEILCESSKLSFCRLWKMPVGLAEIRGHEVRFGIPGMPDLMGIVRHKSGLGLSVGIEVKTGKGIRTKNQIAFHTMLGKYCMENFPQVFVARDLDSALVWLKAVSQA